MSERLSPHLQTVNRINGAIATRRDRFIDQYRQGHMGSRLLTYEPALDREVYKTLNNFRNEGTAYEHARNNLNGYTAFQVETFVGERLNVGLSSFRYDLKDGQLYGQGMDEPLLAMIQRGRDCRDVLADDVDKPRQDAEMVQFAKIQDVFGNSETPVGTTIVSISPPGGEGSAYSHNFYDVFVLSEDAKTNERFVAGHRYAADLGLEEYKVKVEELVPDYFAEYKNEPIDSYFLSHPLVLDTNSPLSGAPEKVHANFHNGHEFLSTEDFGEVKQAIAGLVVSYVNTLCDTPENVQYLNLTLNAIINKADHVAERLRRKELLPMENRAAQRDETPHGVHAEIMKLGKQKVREVSTGCGSSSGFDTENTLASNLSSFNATDFGKDNFGSRSFNCPECGEMNIRPVNQLVSNCQHCGSEKVAC